MQWYRRVGASLRSLLLCLSVPTAPSENSQPGFQNSFPLLPSYWRRECKLHHISSWGGSYTMQGKENLVRADQLARGCACPLHHAYTHTHTHPPFLSVCQPPPLFCLEEGAVKSRVEGRFCFCLCSSYHQDQASELPLESPGHSPVTQGTSQGHPHPPHASGFLLLPEGEAADQAGR